MKKMLAMILALAMAVSLCACAGSGGSGSSGNSGSSSGSGSSAGGDSAATEDFTPVTWKFGNQHNSTQIATIIDKEIAEEIEAATEGRVQIDLYTDSALGDYTSVFDELMLGTVQMANITGVDTYGGLLNAAMIPYLLTDWEQCNVAYRPDGVIFGAVSELLEGLGVKLMGFVPEDFVGIGTQKELTNANVPGAEKGALIRVPMTDVFALSTMDLGFRTSSIAYSDSYAALQTGVVDGMDGNGALATCTAFGDVTKYFYNYQHLCEATMILISASAWNELLPQDQEAITKIIYDKCTEIPGRAQALEEEYMAKMTADYGIEIVNFTPEELEAFAASCREKVWPQLAEAYPDGFLDEVLADIQGNM